MNLAQDAAKPKGQANCAREHRVPHIAVTILALLSYWLGVYALRSALWTVGMVAIGVLAWFAVSAPT